jgi:hypothetical protein
MFSTFFISFLDNKPSYQKLVKIKDTQFCMESLKMKRKNELLKVMRSNPGKEVKIS